MEEADDENDLKLVRASAALLADLETSLPKLLWKRSKTGTGRGLVHRQVRRRDLEYVVRLIEPFQGEPQLLDARLKHILPPIIEAYLHYIATDHGDKISRHLDLQSAVCTILYTLCKVRGYKIVLGFFNNEPRYLEPILNQLEAATTPAADRELEWQVQYILLLWTAHLMLVPFDLASISPTREAGSSSALPVLVERLQNIGIAMLSSPTKAQDAAAFLLVRLVTRPDMLKIGLAGSITSVLQDKVKPKDPSTGTASIYEPLGLLRYYAAISATELYDSVAEIYRKCRILADNDDSILAGNAVAKKLFIKIYRNTVIQALRVSSGPNSLTFLLESSGLGEDVIDHLLQSLSDRDTPVRYAAAKALSRIVQQLQPEMGFEVIQAVLESFKEDMPRGGETLDFRTANPLKWHGLTLTLAHMLFKRSAALGQLQDIVSALILALQFEQRTATGSSVGTNVRDAANFGLWALSRRYTTKELLSVDIAGLPSLVSTSESQSVIQTIAMELVLSACLDPVGNVRRGSSAALQELVGRHPDQVAEGISLVQVVDYQAVGLRRRAMVDVAVRAADLPGDRTTYWLALVDGLLGWRGIGSPDVASREATGAAFARSAGSGVEAADHLLAMLKEQLSLRHDVEVLHGLVISIACLLEEIEQTYGQQKQRYGVLPISSVRSILEVLVKETESITTRVVNALLPAAVTRFCAALCTYMASASTEEDVPMDLLETLVKRLLARQENSVQLTLPTLVTRLLALKRTRSIPLDCIGAQTLSRKVAVDGSKSTLNGACGAVALGALAPEYDRDLTGEGATAAISTLAALTEAKNVDWRIIGIKALRLAVDSLEPGDVVDEDLSQSFVDAVHRGLNDYTIDERGDIGSLVRLQAITCASSIFSKPVFAQPTGLSMVLEADMYRLSLEKLDRVRLEAAQSCARHMDTGIVATDVGSVSTQQYFLLTLGPLRRDQALWKHRALLEGCILCTGVSSETVLESSRSALVQILQDLDKRSLSNLLSTFATILKSYLFDSPNTIHPALELLAFLLDMQAPQRLSTSDFKWLNLLSTVQKSHHKSNDIPKILAAVQVYRGLSEIPVIRDEVLKKLVGMLKTNPYPRVRVSVAETLFVITREEALKGRDWTKAPAQNAGVVAKILERYVGG